MKQSADYESCKKMRLQSTTDQYKLQPMRESACKSSYKAIPLSNKTYKQSCSNTCKTVISAITIPEPDSSMRDQKERIKAILTVLGGFLYMLVSTLFVKIGVISL